ncbi:MAG TPA: NYN domain-containing protein [Gemmataceae bacterium]|nr:NYN domain-containing protein [Gemmataceae bacterium]
MPYLIDGYNLLHAMGVLHGRLGPQGLEKARLRLLGLLRGSYGDEAPAVTVVFDAAGAPPGAAEEHDYHGLHVRYAVHQQQADDLIELLIQHDSAPRQLVVVSDDHRLQKAARHRHCPVMGCLDYVEDLQRRRRHNRRRPDQEPDKKPVVSPDEMQHWLGEFADLADDPDLKQLFDPFDFEKDQT